MKARWMTPSESAAPARRVSRSSRSPRSTSAPAAATAAADESDLASPTTLCPAPISSGTTAEPIQPDAPVTNTRMTTSLMSVTVISLTPMTVTVITYHFAMGRWEPNARGRLAQAALTLYVEQGFERTTVAEIAARAGLTERTFFRHFADKREVLFYGMERLRGLLARAVADAPASAAPMELVGAAFEAAAAMLQENPERVRLRDAIVSANAELRERELIKLAALASAVAGALRDRGVPEPAASLAAETGAAVFKTAFARWISEPGEPDLPGIIRESVRELRGMLTGWLASAGTPAPP